MKLRILFLFILPLIGSCKKNNEIATTDQTTVFTGDEKSYSFSQKVLPKFNNAIANWREYQAMNDFLNSNFKRTNYRQALENGKMLGDLSRSLKDSVLPAILNDPSLNARLNLVYSESLRIQDMAEISSIKEEEVDLQISKLFNAFSMVNAKINEMLEQKELQKLYGDLPSNIVKPNEVPKNDKKSGKKNTKASDRVKVVSSKKKPKKKQAFVVKDFEKTKKKNQ